MDLIGKRYERLSVKNIFGKDNHGNVYECVCDCGNIVYIPRRSLVGKNTMSCGCLRKEMTIKRTKKHGERHTRLYRTWYSIKDRCCNSKCKAYMNYGGRGITICDEWKDSYILFRDWALHNGYSDNLTIDRIDNNGNYEPINCRWVDRITQANNKRNNIFYKISDIKIPLAQYCRQNNLPYKLIVNRLRYGWSLEDAINKPKRVKK